MKLLAGNVPGRAASKVSSRVAGNDRVSSHICTVPHLCTGHPPPSPKVSPPLYQVLSSLLAGIISSYGSLQQGAIVTQRGLLEHRRMPWNQVSLVKTAGPHETHVTMAASWILMEQTVTSGTAGCHGTQVPLGHCQA